MKLFKIGYSESMGREVIAIKTIPKGTLIELCEILILSESDTIAVNKTELQWYTFKFNSTQDCLVLGNGEIFNHSDKPNVKYELIHKNGRMMMQFIALKDIPAFSQLFIDYSADTNVLTSGYINNKSLI